MTFQELLPIIIPGILLQILVQAYYIKHCWENSRLSQKQKAAYIILIMIFNSPAAAFYLLKTREKEFAESFNLQPAAEQEIDSQTQQGIFVLLLVAYQVLALRIITVNRGSEHFSLIVLLLGGCLVTLILNGLLRQMKFIYLDHLLSVTSIILVTLAAHFDRSGGAQFIILTIMASVINLMSLKWGRLYALLILFISMLIVISKEIATYGSLIPDDAISSVYVNLLIYILVFAVFYSLKKQLLANRQLADTLSTLKKQALKLEEMSVMAERSRVVGEIHDTVGHTLTTAVIAIEAGESLFSQDALAALAKFQLAGNQVRQGLHDLRSSVRTIQNGASHDFEYNLHQLLNNIRQNSDLQIFQIIDIQSDLLSIQQNVLLNAIKEFTTNSLKHGHSSTIDLLLQEHRGMIQLTLSDDGTGTEHIRFGFGLQSLSDRIKSIGGTMKVESELHEGFTLTLSMPTGLQQEREQQ